MVAPLHTQSEETVVLEFMVRLDETGDPEDQRKKDLSNLDAEQLGKALALLILHEGNMVMDSADLEGTIIEVSCTNADYL